MKKLQPRGGITVPADVLDAAGAHEGDILEFQLVRIIRRNGKRQG